MTLDQALLAAVAALASVVVYLHKGQRTGDDRNAELAERVGRVEGKQEAIENLSAKTLEMVRQAKKCNYAESNGDSAD
mgnify:CR=1 FL=1